MTDKIGPKYIALRMLEMGFLFTPGETGIFTFKFLIKISSEENMNPETVKP